MDETAITLFIYRRDLRVIDNTGLNYAMNKYKRVVPIFIFTPTQIQTAGVSLSAIKFMIESLRELDLELKRAKSQLHVFMGHNDVVIAQLLRKWNIGAVVFNRDYTPYARARDASLSSICKRAGVVCVGCEDYLLSNMGELNRDSETPYVIFTPFKNNALSHTPRHPTRTRVRNLYKLRGYTESPHAVDGVDIIKQLSISFTNINSAVSGGRKRGLQQLNKIATMRHYNKTRDIMAIPTSRLSAYIKFGCISIREVYWRIRDNLGISSTLMSQLYWREFYYYIVWEFPHVMGKNFNPKYNKIKWRWSRARFQRWCDGTTGYPIVDAGMRELATSHIMHNRARLITANFLNRILGMDWRRGEQYYRSQLVDYDPAVNNGNWQWVASTGVDPKPYFQRLFNPWLQSAKFDPDATYIKKWLPNLAKIPAQHLHEWDKYYSEYDLEKIKYVKPMVDYDSARKLSIAQYQAVL
jgi:deoxyribodipyrimidine photo-lyase